MAKRRFSKLSKHWCYTINNLTEEDGGSIEDAKKMFAYNVVGKEIGVDGTKHMQGYVIFINRKRLAGVKKIFPRAHLEIKKGTILEAATYCKKDGDFMEYGELPVDTSERVTKSNKRDWDAFRLAAKEGRMEDIPSDMYIRYRVNIWGIYYDHGGNMLQVLSCFEEDKTGSSSKTC